MLAYGLLAPALLWLGGVLLASVWYLIGQSLSNERVLGGEREFVGLAQYREVLLDPSFWQAGWRTLLWVVGNVVLQTVLSLGAALLLYRSRRLAWFNIWVVLPWIVPTVVAVIIWRWMLSSIGIVNQAIQAVGLSQEPVAFFGSGTVALLTLMLINSWKFFPLGTVILVAALRSIPTTLVEAARVDGASEAQVFWRVQLPLLQPVMYVLGLVGPLWAVNVFELPWLLTRGGPGDATLTWPLHIYLEAFGRFEIGLAAAASLVVSLVLMGFVGLYLKTGWGRALREEQ